MDAAKYTGANGSLRIATMIAVAGLSTLLQKDLQYQYPHKNQGVEMAFKPPKNTPELEKEIGEELQRIADAHPAALVMSAKYLIKEGEIEVREVSEWLSLIHI